MRHHVQLAFDPFDVVNAGRLDGSLCHRGRTVFSRWRTQIAIMRQPGPASHLTVAIRPVVGVDDNRAAQPPRLSKGGVRPTPSATACRNISG